LLQLALDMLGAYGLPLFLNLRPPGSVCRLGGWSAYASFAPSATVCSEVLSAEFSDPYPL